MSTFLRYSIDLFARPRAALRALLGEPDRILFGLVGNVLLALIYFAGITTALALNVSHLPQSPALRIPDEQYYSIERFFILPVGLAGTILAAGAIRLLAQAWNGEGHYEDLFALLGFSFTAVAILMGVPDLVITILRGIGVPVSMWWVLSGPQIWLGTLWYVVLTILAVKEVERLTWGKTIVLTLLGSVANALVNFIFIR